MNFNIRKYSFIPFSPNAPEKSQQAQLWPLSSSSSSQLSSPKKLFEAKRRFLMQLEATQEIPKQLQESYRGGPQNQQ